MALVVVGSKGEPIGGVGIGIWPGVPVGLSRQMVHRYFRFLELGDCLPPGFGSVR